MDSKCAKHTSQSVIVKNSPSYNVVLAGESGTGKTAVINLVYDNIQLNTSSSAVGCTNQCQSVRGSPADYPDLNLRIVDTVGLSESSEGTVPSEEALHMLENKLDSLYSKDGIHLILFCIRKGRQSEITKQHYQTITHDLCDDQVPCLLVITRCEDDDPLGEWWQENEKILREQLKFNVIDAVAVTAIKTEETLYDFKKSRERLIEAIQKYALKQPWRAHGFRQKFNLLFKSKAAGKSNVNSPKTDPYKEYLKRPMDTTPPKKSFWSWR